MKHVKKFFDDRNDINDYSRPDDRRRQYDQRVREVQNILYGTKNSINIIYGGPNSGKSTLLWLLEKILENRCIRVSGESFNELEEKGRDNRFEPSKSFCDAEYVIVSENGHVSIKTIKKYIKAPTFYLLNRGPYPNKPKKFIICCDGINEKIRDDPEIYCVRYETLRNPDPYFYRLVDMYYELFEKYIRDYTPPEDENDDTAIEDVSNKNEDKDYKVKYVLICREDTHETYCVNADNHSDIVKYFIKHPVKDYFDGDLLEYEFTTKSIETIRKAWNGEDFNLEDIDADDLEGLFATLDQWQIIKSKCI